MNRETLFEHTGERIDGGGAKDATHFERPNARVLDDQLTDIVAIELGNDVRKGRVAERKETGTPGETPCGLGDWEPCHLNGVAFGADNAPSGQRDAIRRGGFRRAAGVAL